MAPEQHFNGLQRDSIDQKKPSSLPHLVGGKTLRLAAALLAFIPSSAEAPGDEHSHAERPVAEGKAPDLPEHLLLGHGQTRHGQKTQQVANMTRKQVEATLPHRTEYTTLQEILNFYRCHCVDGREDEAVVGVPGGDLGILMAGLSAYEDLTGKQLSADDVQALISDYPHLYLHTDDHGTHALEEKIKMIPELKTILTKKGIGQLLEEGTGDAHLDTLLLDATSDPQTVGCGHMKLMITKAEEYGTRAALAKAVWRAAFRRNWAQTNAVQLDILAGDHAETSVMSIAIDGKMENTTRIPMLRPNDEGSQTFVSHAGVAKYCLTEELLPHLQGLAQKRILPLPDHDALENKAVQKLTQQAVVTVNALAKNRPLYEVEFDVSGQCTIKDKGIVGRP